jgi:hypothetical protein
MSLMHPAVGDRRRQMRSSGGESPQLFSRCDCDFPSKQVYGNICPKLPRQARALHQQGSEAYVTFGLVIREELRQGQHPSRS